jgi:hypothetical protein
MQTISLKTEIRFMERREEDLRLMSINSIRLLKILTRVKVRRSPLICEKSLNFNTIKVNFLVKLITIILRHHLEKIMFFSNQLIEILRSQVPRLINNQKLLFMAILISSVMQEVKRGQCLKRTLRSFILQISHLRILLKFEKVISKTPELLPLNQSSMT